MTFGLPPSMTATQLLVVPKSIPMTLAMCLYLSFTAPHRPLSEAAEMLQFMGHIGGASATTRSSAEAAGLLISLRFPVQGSDGGELGNRNVAQP
jgi:hypothetical protein